MRVQIAKALILTGRTSHDEPWPSVKSGPKQLVPVANRPIVVHALESLRRAGIIEATIAVEPDIARPIMSALGDGSGQGIAIRYVRWRPRSGIAGALDAARDFIGREPLLVEPADALHRDRIHPYIAAFAEERLDAMEFQLSGSPRGPHGQPVPGGYLLSRRAQSALLRGSADSNVTAGVIESGGTVRVQEVSGCLPCHGGQDRLLEGNRRMLEELRGDVDPGAYPTCEFQGPVQVHRSARLDHTIVRGPAVIGPDARLVHAYVGPYTSIGTGVTIEGSQVEHSIVLDGAALLHVGSRIESSVIGRRARVARSFALPTAMQLSVGDGAEITIA
jgi:glucose-1-phosphate thymidylyltransferase